MRKLGIWLLVGMLLTGCRFLPQSREMGEMALVRSVGVDPAEAGVSLTLSTGPQAQGTKGEQKPALNLHVEGASLPAAAFAAQTRSDRSVFFGYADQLLVGEEQARQGLEETLGWFAADGELSLGARVWVVRGDTAQAAIDSGGDEGVDRRLSNLRMDGQTGAAPVSRTALELLIALGEQGCAYTPALVLEEEGLQPGGYALLTREGLRGYLEEEAARGLELLSEHPAAEVLEVLLEDGTVSVRITSSQVDVDPVFGRRGLEELGILCRTEGEILYQTGEHTPNGREQTARQVEAELKRRLNLALGELQQAGCDCVSLGNRVAMAEPWYAPAMVEDWEEEFSRLKTEVQVNVTLGMERG